MQKVELVKAIKVFDIEYCKKFSKERIDLWYEQFKDMDIKKFKTGVNKVLVKCKFPPTLADMYNACLPEYKNV